MAVWSWRHSPAWRMPSSTWCRPATRSRPITWSRSSASWTSARGWWSIRPRSSSSRRRSGTSSTPSPLPSLPPDMNVKAAPARLSTASAGFEADFQARLHWSADTDAAIEQVVADILADVRRRGDAAVLDYTRRFDGLEAESVQQLELTQADFKAAFDSLPVVQRDALRMAAER